MHTIYHLRASELNDRFLASIRALFQDQMIEIAISDIGQAPRDEAMAAPGFTTPRTSSPGDRIGVAHGRFEVPDDIDTHNDEVARLFLGADSDDSAP